MEFSPVDPTTDDHQDEQESMFEHAVDFPGHDLTELPQVIEEPESFAAVERDDYAEPPLAASEEWRAEERSEDRVNAGAAAQISPETELPAKTYPNADPDPAPEPAHEAVDLTAGAGPLTIGDFAVLEERVLRAVNLVRRERHARHAADQRAEVLQGRVLALESQLPQMQADAAALELLQQEVETLRTEREQVRQRVERLLGQLDALDL